MTFKGRSPDDMPLAAYGGTGMDLSAEDEVALASAEPDPESQATAFADAAARVGAAGAVAGAEATEPATPAAIELPDDNFGSGRPAEPRSLPPAVGKVVTTLRTSRLAAGAAFVGVIAVGLLLLSGANRPAASGATPTASPAPVAVTTPAPPTGDATVEVTGKLAGAYTLAGTTGTGPAVGGRIATTWADPTGASLALSGPASAGTRTTDPTFSLTWTVLVDGAPLTFSSTAGECTVGMAVQPNSVTGSFVCKKLRSADGKLTVNVRGTYRT